MKKVFMFAMMASAMFFTACNKTAVETEKKDGAPTMPEMVAFRLAGELAKYGQEVGDPLALIEAADILASIPTWEFEVKQIVVSAEVPNEGEKTKIALEPEALLAMAKELSSEDELLLAYIAKIEAKLSVEAGGTRGTMGGYIQRNCFTVYANGTDCFTLSCVADRPIEIMVFGDGDTNLDIYVYDQNENLIESDEGSSDYGDISWCPTWTGTYILKIVNRGHLYNDYCILIY